MNPDPAETSESSGVVRRVSDAILDLVAVVHVSTEAPSATPQARAAELIEKAALSSAKISGLAAMAPGPLGLLTLLPDLVAMWRIQSQLVSDIAAVYGKTAHLGKEHMLWCLFRHSAAQTFRDVVYRAGERYLIRPLGLRALQKLSANIGVKLSQRAFGKAVARFLPLIGAAGVAGYAYYDTRKVGAAAVDIFSKEPVFLGEVEAV
ncbi:MAG: EcsC family protein [Rhodoferax sp.]|nr:EcsC family protein [Rhodoferax sp.]